MVVMLVPLPMFWALYDQQYSVWVVQTLQMDCRLWGDVLLLPDQMQIINPGLVRPPLRNCIFNLIFFINYYSSILLYFFACVKEKLI
jgi:hypothetical protein